MCYPIYTCNGLLYSVHLLVRTIFTKFEQNKNKNNSRIGSILKTSQGINAIPYYQYSDIPTVCVRYKIRFHLYGIRFCSMDCTDSESTCIWYIILSMSYQEYILSNNNKKEIIIK